MRHEFHRAAVGKIKNKQKSADLRQSLILISGDEVNIQVHRSTWETTIFIMKRTPKIFVLIAMLRYGWLKMTRKSPWRHHTSRSRIGQLSRLRYTISGLTNAQDNTVTGSDGVGNIKNGLVCRITVSVSLRSPAENHLKSLSTGSPFSVRDKYTVLTHLQFVS